jgi:pyruvate dehydrogenase E1 component
MGIIEGQEWEKFAGMQRRRGRSSRAALRSQVPFNASAAGAGSTKRPRSRSAQASRCRSIKGAMSTQEGFGKILAEIARSGDAARGPHRHDLARCHGLDQSRRPGSTARGLFARSVKEDIFKPRASSFRRSAGRLGPKGQHVELGIAEMNLFLNLAALGLSHSLFGERLIPIGTLYDPFIARGLDALNYACYQDARFILVATPSGVTLAPEGGAHQSIANPARSAWRRTGSRASSRPIVDELGVILEWTFDYIQREGKAKAGEWTHEREGGSVYLRLSTRPIDQVLRPMTPELRRGIIDGAYWLREPQEGASFALAYQGVVAPEAASAMGEIVGRSGAGLLAVTSADRLEAGWRAAQKARQLGDCDATSHIERLLAPLARDARLATVIDGHPATLSWLGAVHGHRVEALGVDAFGQTGTISDAYRLHRIDAEAIVEASQAAMAGKVRPR